MAIATVSVFRLKPDKLQEFWKRAVEARKIHERLGAKVRVWQTVFGSEPSTVYYAVEVADWNALGAYWSSLEADDGWRRFWLQHATDPAADLVQHQLVIESPEMGYWGRQD